MAVNLVGLMVTNLVHLMAVSSVGLMAHWMVVNSAHQMAQRLNRWQSHIASTPYGKAWCTSEFESFCEPYCRTKTTDVPAADCSIASAGY